MEIVRCTSRPLHGCCNRFRMLRIAPQQRRSSRRSALYNREDELQKLGDFLDEDPGSINVILGPRSCGKTAILRSYAKDKPKVVYLNCRERKVSTPAAFVTTLVELLEQKASEQSKDDVRKFLQNALYALVFLATAVKVDWKDVSVPTVPGKEGMSISISDLAKTWMDINKRSGAPQDLDVIYKAIRKLLDAWDKPLSSQDDYEWPVLVIDEANKLQQWRDDDSSELAELLSFLVYISKESQRCHVLLATSEYGFQAWLNDAIGPDFWHPKVIGDFTEEHARKFLESKLLRKHERRQRQVGDNATRVKLDDAAWMKVYKVCGGNAGNLVRLSAEIGREDWDTALERLWRVQRQRVRNLAVGVRGAWTRAQYAEVALQLLDSRYHAIPQADVETMLGRHVVTAAASASLQQEAGVPVLKQLVKANALTLRPYSDWAQDIPREAFDNADDVVTAPSALNLYCISELRQVLQTYLQAATGHSP